MGSHNKKFTSVDTEMCCPKRQVWISIFHSINFKRKKIRGHRSPGFFDKN